MRSAITQLVVRAALTAATTAAALMLVRRDPRRCEEFRFDAAFAYSRRCRNAAAKLRDGNYRILSEFTEQQAIHVRAEAARQQYGVSPAEYGRLYARAAARLTSPVVAPESKAQTEDIVLAWRQPEAVALWSRIGHGPVRPSTVPAIEGTKGALVAMTALRRGPHFVSGVDALRDSRQLWDLVTWLSRESASIGMDHEPILREYSVCTRHLTKIAPPIAFECMRANVSIVQALAAMFPMSPIGRYFVIDGTDIPAWTRQVSGKRNGVVDEAVERRLRRRIPEAEFVVFGHGKKGHVYSSDSDDDLEGVTQIGGRYSKRWRGFRLIVISEGVTGIPVVGVLVRGGLFETHAVEPLMDLLFTVWPDANPEVLVGDKLYDAAGVAELLATRYGVHLVAIAKPSRLAEVKRFDDVKRYRHGVSVLNGDGIAYCRRHNVRMEYDGMEPPSRAGLAPGDPTPASAFRSRWRCPHGHRPSMATELAWRTLAYYPHNPIGRPGLYAEREALIMRRNQAETAFSSLKSSFKQGLNGPCRTRLFQKESYEAAIWMCFATRALLLIAAARTEDGG